MRRVQVVMYMTSWCPVCRQARDWLNARGYRFSEYDVEHNLRAASIMREVNPRGSVPMFEIDGQVLIGFHPTLLQQALRQAARERREANLATRAKHSASNGPP